ncbi:MAG: response regulator transcription factor [Cyanobacteria bacterium SZAS-4]|nr:response regulator transcription factor [Cyanobacteria bacterium SZAS-4]
MTTTLNTASGVATSFSELTNQVNVVLVSDCEISMAGLKTVLRKSGRITVVSECESLDDVAATCLTLTPEIVIFNVAASKDEICRVAESVTAASKSTRMIVMNKTWTVGQIAEAFSRGILGFLTPPNPAGCLMIALESVVRGCLWIGPNPLMVSEQQKLESSAPFGRGDTAGSSSAKDALSPREAEIAALVSQGLSNRAISEVLIITVDTVKSHIHHIMTKLDVRDRTQIVMKLNPLAQEVLHRRPPFDITPSPLSTRLSARFRAVAS